MILVFMVETAKARIIYPSFIFINESKHKFYYINKNSNETAIVENN